MAIRSNGGLPVIIMDPSTGQRKSPFSVSVLLNIAGVDANLERRTKPIVTVHISSVKRKMAQSIRPRKLAEKNRGQCLVLVYFFLSQSLSGIS